jgi:CRP-like cAMP-binding protein
LTKKSAFGEPFFLEHLPQPIMYRVVKQMNEDAIRSVRLFHTYEMDFVVPLLLVIKPFQAAAGDVIYGEGDLCDSIVFLKKGKIALSSSNGFKKVLVGYVRSGGYFGDMEYLRKTTCIATYSAAKHSHLLAVPHSQVNSASNKCLEAGVRFRKENQIRYELFNQVLTQNKKGADNKAGAKLTLEESRQIVDKLMRTGKRGSAAAPRWSLLRTAMSPRNSATGVTTPVTSSGASGRFSSRNTTPRTPSLAEAAAAVQAATKEQGSDKSEKTLRRGSAPTAGAVTSLWIDGAVVGTRNLTLLARNVEKTLPMDQEETIVRVVYVNPHGRVAPGEVPMSYIAGQWVIHPLNQNKVMWDVMMMLLIFFSVITVPVEIAFNELLYPGSPMVDKGKQFATSILLCV